MYTITENNVNDAFVSGMLLLKSVGKPEESRGGRVSVSPEPVCTTYLRPWERVITHPHRDANPFFHLMEAIWMMAGRKDVAFVAQFNKQMAEYSDDGVDFHAAYGYRWRRHFGYDQIKHVRQVLWDDPTSRRAVISIWDPRVDGLEDSGKDYPCNLNICFDLRHDKLNMTVFNRSNDAIWGTYGANAVHMSVLQEVLAGMLDVQMGEYRQITNNLHMYINAPRVEDMLTNIYHRDPYTHKVMHYPLVTKGAAWNWLEEAVAFCENPGSVRHWLNHWFEDVAQPMYMLWTTRDMKWLEKIQASDWKLACKEWLDRRAK